MVNNLKPKTMDNQNNLWNNCLALIREKVKPHVYDTWFAPITLESYDEEKNTVVLEVPSTYVYEYIEELHVPLMNWALSTAFKQGVKLGYRIRKEPVAAPAVEYPSGPQIPHFQIRDAKERLQNGLKHFLGDKALWLPCYDKVADWLGDNKGRGVLCVGTSGLGKTLISEKILPVILGRKIRAVNANDLHDRLDDLLKERAVIVDDLGKEPARHYGEQDRSFFKLCDAAEQRGILLIITTNLSTTPVSEANRAIYPLSIQERYGNEVLSRLRATTTVIGFQGDDLRK